MQGVVGFLITSLLQIYQGIFHAKKLWKSVKIWQNYGREFVVSLFWPSHVGKMHKNLVKIGHVVPEIC